MSYILKNKHGKYLTSIDGSYAGMSWEQGIGEKTMVFNSSTLAERFLNSLTGDKEGIHVVYIGEAIEDKPKKSFRPDATWYAEQASIHLRMADQCDIITEASLRTALGHAKFAACFFELALAKNQGELFI